MTGDWEPVTITGATVGYRARSLTLKEAAELLGVTPDNLRGAIARGSLKATKLGRDWIVTPSEVERYRKDHRRDYQRRPVDG